MDTSNQAVTRPNGIVKSSRSSARKNGLTQAVDLLKENGVDRARLSVLATGTEEEGVRLRAAGFVTVSDVLSAGDALWTAYTQPEDVATAKGPVVSALVYVGATLGAGIAAAAAGPMMPAIIAAAVASGAAGGEIGAFLIHRFGGGHADDIGQSLAHGGLVLWVHVTTPEDERRVADLLTGAQGQGVIAQDVP